MEEIVTVIRDSFNPAEYAQAAKALSATKTKGKGNTWVAIGIIGLFAAGIAYYLYKKNKEDTKPSKSTAKNHQH